MRGSVMNNISFEDTKAVHGFDVQWEKVQWKWKRHCRMFMDSRLTSYR